MVGIVNRCVFYIQARLSVTVCGVDAPFMWKGSSYCHAHIQECVQGRTWKELE